MVWSHHQEIIQPLCCYFLHITLFKHAVASTQSYPDWLNHLCYSKHPKQKQEQDFSFFSAQRSCVLFKLLHAICNPRHISIQLSILYRVTPIQRFNSSNKHILNACICQFIQTLTCFFAPILSENFNLIPNELWQLPTAFFSTCYSFSVKGVIKTNHL